MRGLLRLALVVAVLLVVAEVLVPPWVEDQAEAAVAEETGGNLTVDVEVSGPPLVLPVAVDGIVSRWSLELARVADRDVPVEVVVDLHEVTLDRGRLVRGDVVVTEVARADATVVVDLSDEVPEALMPVVDRLADVGLSRLLEGVGDGVVQRRGGALVLDDLSLPLVDGSCDVTNETLVVTTRCELAEVPPVLLRAFQ